MSSPNYPVPGTGWRVISQTPGSEVGADGRVADGMVVGFTTARGLTGSVFVPWAGYGPAAVTEAVGMRASLLDSVHGLTG